MEYTCENNASARPRVAVLMSTYNGENYVQEQIDSILNQTWKNTRLYVRDDGSTDGTLKILKENEKAGRLVLFSGKNLGFVNSFFSLLIRCPQADYYAWCDQDDIWMPGKLERAVVLLEQDRKNHEKEEMVPVLYFSDYDFYDGQMRFQKHGLDHKRGPSFANSLMDCIPLGFNSVFNPQAREMMVQKRPHHSCGHDWWTYMVCAAFGRVIYDRGFVSVKYRRLEKSVSPGGKAFWEKQIWRFKKFFVNDYFRKIRRQLREFASLYAPCLKENDQKILRLFTNRRYSLIMAVRKACYPVWFRQGLLEELMVRTLFLIGKL